MRGEAETMRGRGDVNQFVSSMESRRRFQSTGICSAPSAMSFANAHSPAGAEGEDCAGETPRSAERSKRSKAACQSCGTFKPSPARSAMRWAVSALIWSIAILVRRLSCRLGYAAAHPLRKQPFLAARGCEPGVLREPVGLTVRLNVPEEERVALISLVTPADGREISLASAVAIVQIAKEGEHALAEFSDLPGVTRRIGVEEIEVREILLAHCVMQNGSALHCHDRRSGQRRDARSHKMGDEIGLGEIEFRRAVGARGFVTAFAGRRIVGSSGPQVEPPSFNQPIANLRGGKFFYDPETRTFRDQFCLRH